jgi:hypothetical protein
MPDYTLISTRARNADFDFRVRAALVVKARAVYVAGPTGQEQAYIYAASVFRDVLQYAQIAAWAMATDPAIIDVPIATTIPDATIELAMNRTWPALVGLRA